MGLRITVWFRQNTCSFSASHIRNRMTINEKLLSLRFRWENGMETCWWKWIDSSFDSTRQPWRRSLWVKLSWKEQQAEQFLFNVLWTNYLKKRKKLSKNNANNNTKQKCIHFNKPLFRTFPLFSFTTDMFYNDSSLRALPQMITLRHKMKQKMWKTLTRVKLASNCC